jgi:hypothetical protein
LDVAIAWLSGSGFGTLTIQFVSCPLTSCQNVQKTISTLNDIRNVIDEFHRIIQTILDNIQANQLASELWDQVHSVLNGLWGRVIEADGDFNGALEALQNARNLNEAMTDLS